MLRKLRYGFCLIMIFFILTGCSHDYGYCDNEICYCDDIARDMHFPSMELRVDERFADVEWHLNYIDAYYFLMNIAISNNSSYYITIMSIPRIEFLYNNEWFSAFPGPGTGALFTQASGTSKELTADLMFTYPLPRVDLFRVRLEMSMHQETVWRYYMYDLPRHDMVLYFVNNFDFILCYCLENNLLFDISMFEQSPPTEVCSSGVFTNFEWSLNEIEFVIVTAGSDHRYREILALSTQISYNGAITDNTAWSLLSCFVYYLDFFYSGNWYQAPLHIYSRRVPRSVSFFRTSDYFGENQNTANVSRIFLTAFCHPLPVAELYRMRSRFELVTDSQTFYQYFVIEFEL